MRNAGLKLKPSYGYSTVDKENLPKFFLNCLNKGFNSKEKFTLHDLQKICEKEGIKYSTNTWV